MNRAGPNLGPYFVVALVVLGFFGWRAFFGFDPLPWLRGMQLGLPLVCILAAGVAVVLWAGKFLDIR
jgi:hypothetical protein